MVKPAVLNEKTQRHPARHPEAVAIVVQLRGSIVRQQPSPLDESNENSHTADLKENGSFFKIRMEN